MFVTIYALKPLIQACAYLTSLASRYDDEKRKFTSVSYDKKVLQFRVLGGKEEAADQ